MLRRVLAIAFAISVVTTSTVPAFAQLPPPFEQMSKQLRHLASEVPAQTALDVLDLKSGDSAGFNAAASMPAASTIKVPVMVEVFRQLERGRFDLERRVTLLESDKDWGSGDLCDAPVGSRYTVSTLLSKMIDISDNTAANMLIRLVGRRKINETMLELGLEHTKLHGYIRTDDWAVRRELRTSPADLVRLLALMARRELVDEWSSNEMISILSEDEYNTLLPEPLPDDVMIAHKTGSFFDTLDDAGIVYANDAPYVIAVMTTGLPSLDLGRDFIHTISRLAYTDELRFAQWREEMGVQPVFDLDMPGVSNAPDVRYWSNPVQAEASGGL